MSVLASQPVAPVSRPGVDPRGLRFAATLTTVVLAVVLLTLPSPVAVVLLAAQTVVFGLGAVLGARAQPYGIVFRRLLRPRLGAPARLEHPAPPRFAQSVGLGFGVVGLVGVAVGSVPVTYLAVGLALAAAFLNAAFDFCLGCELYLRVSRVRQRIAGGPGRRTETPAVSRSYIEGETA